MNARIEPQGIARRALTASLCAAVCGCAIIGSTPDTPGADRRGVSYMLPKGLLPVELVEADSVLMLRLQPAVTVGDPNQRYFLAHHHNAFSSDDVKVVVDPATNMLTSITATGSDKTLSVITELVRASTVRRLEGGDAPASETVVYRGYYDPDGDDGEDSPNARLIAGLEAALRERVNANLQGCTATPQPANCASFKSINAALAPAEKPATKKNDGNPAGKDGVTKLVRVSATPLGGSSTPTVSTSAQPAADGKPAANPDCSAGVCYRSLRPFQVELSVLGVNTQSTVVLLPNGGVPVLLPLDRAPFVETAYTVEFSGGQLQSVQTKRPSSALALVSWPVDVYRAVLDATTTFIQLRVGADKERVTLAQSELDTAKSLKNIREEMDKLRREGGSALTADTVLGGPSRGTALLAIEFGQRPLRKVGTFPNSPGTVGAVGVVPGQPGAGAQGGLGGAGARPGQAQDPQAPGAH
ncbi:MAG: hypothetical protein JNJ60_22380 [Rhodocyclaceae bacterium]|nr:hypothetical protein [Rhodocyclaceae bacterium]